MAEFIVSKPAKDQTSIAMILLTTGSFLFVEIYCATSQTIPSSMTPEIDLWLPIFARPVLWLTAAAGLSFLAVSKLPIFNISCPQRSRDQSNSDEPIPVTASLPVCQRDVLQAVTYPCLSAHPTRYPLWVRHVVFIETRS